ncbi:MAG: hypothetical protein PVI46_10755 [Lysobacterales bacterium]
MKHMLHGVLGGALLAALLSITNVHAQSRTATANEAASRPAAMKMRAAEPCGAKCEDSGARLAAPTVAPRDYECRGGNCSCAGAEDCVAMKKICAPGTLGCNDYGCTCAEGEEPEGDGG